MTRLAFLLDVDNTLLANDEVKEHLDQHLRKIMGSKLTRHFWNIYEQVRQDQGVVNIPLSLQHLREEVSQEQLDGQTYQQVRAVFDTYPFSQYLYPRAIETLHYLRTLGLTIIVSDGDQYFQAEKIKDSRLAEAVEGRVLIYTHKQQHLEDILHTYPAEHYVMIDDKPQILVESKQILAKRLTTVFVKQGKYAQQATNAKPDICVEQIGDLRDYTAEDFLRA